MSGALLYHSLLTRALWPVSDYAQPQALELTCHSAPIYFYIILAAMFHKPIFENERPKIYAWDR